MKSVIILCATIFAGCATTSSDDWHWHKPGATQQDFAMDDGQCKAQAFGVAGASLLQIALVQQSCLQGKGWTKQASNSGGGRP